MDLTPKWRHVRILKKISDIIRSYNISSYISFDFALKCISHSSLFTKTDLTKKVVSLSPVLYCLSVDNSLFEAYINVVVSKLYDVYFSNFE